MCEPHFYFFKQDAAKNKCYTGDVNYTESKHKTNGSPCMFAKNNLVQL